MVKTSSANPDIFSDMTQVSENFHVWLADRLEENNWGIREAARQIGVSHPTISDILTYRKMPSFDTVLLIAKTFKEDPVYLLQLAGLLPGDESRDITESRAVYKLDDLNEEQLEEVIQFIDWIQDRDEKRPPGQKVQYQRKREGSTPPEVLNK